MANKSKKNLTIALLIVVMIINLCVYLKTENIGSIVIIIVSILTMILTIKRYSEKQ